MLIEIIEKSISPMIISMVGSNNIPPTPSYIYRISADGSDRIAADTSERIIPE